MSNTDQINAFIVASKLIPVLKVNRSTWENVVILGVRGDRLTTRNFTNLSFNHLFDDYPDKFGITEHEAHCLRGFLSNTNQGGNDNNLIYWKGFFALLDLED